MIRLSLLEKINDDSYIVSLCDRRRKELELCIDLLSKDELALMSSIDTAYKIARERYIEKNIPEDERYRFYQKHVPLFRPSI